MFGSIPLSFLALSSFVFSRTVLAIPFRELTTDILPRDVVTHIALDEDTNELIAFYRDGTVHGRYYADMENLIQYHRRDDASTCTNLTVEEAETLSGWDIISQYADDNWGTGSRNTVTNPSSYPSYPAEACVSTEAVQATFTGDPSCQTNNVTTAGELVGTNGSVSIAVAQGFTETSQFTVSNAASIGLSSTTSVSVSFPDVVDISEAVTVSGELTNTQTSSFSAMYSNLVTVTVLMTAPEGKACNAVSSVETCTLQASAQIEYTASGWIWFNYDDKTNGHRKWAASLDTILLGYQRSSNLTMSGSVDASTHASYQGTCS